MKYVFIRDHRGAFPVDLICRSLEVCSSGFYAWLKRPKSPRRRDNLRLLTEIKAVHRRSRKTYGSPRIYAELKVVYIWRLHWTCFTGRSLVGRWAGGLLGNWQ